MRARIIRIGNSQGVRIPKLYRQQTGLRGEVDLEVHDRGIMTADIPRHRWTEAFRAMAERGDDRLLDKGPTNQSDWDQDEWEW
jgi:antitoxin MazE